MRESLSIKEERLPNISSFYPSSLLALGFCLCSLLLTYLTYQSLKQSQYSGEQRHQSYLLATQLTQSSDQLTLMARSYAVTGDKKYLDFYNEIVNFHIVPSFLAPFNGGDEGVFDKVASASEQISPNPLMGELRLSQEEADLLLQARRASNRLSMTELRAFSAVEEGLNSSAGYQNSEARERAISLLYSNSYLLGKSKIKAFIDHFFDLQEPRNIESTQSEIYQHYLLITLTTVSFLLSIIFLMYGLYIQAKNKKVFVKTLRSEVSSRTLELFEKRELLKVALNEMEETKHQLVESEKMASLGNLVAGIAHEVNTPLGISVTLGSFLENNLNALQEKINQGHLKRSDLDSYCDESRKSCALLLSNLDRAANLISSFKKVAVDQSNDEIRTFKLSRYIQEVLLSLHPFIKKTKVKITVNAPSAEPSINSYPGAIAQIATNLVMNALIHAFDNGKQLGKVDFILTIKNESMLMAVCDDGAGMSAEVVHKIFDPFYTTQRGNGGSGLGMNIVYNLVVHKLQGTISCKSNLGEGSKFIIRFPMKVDAEVEEGQG